MPGTNYPTALDTTSSLRTVTDAVDDVLAIDQNYPRDAIIALETKVGFSADTPVAGDVLKGTGTGTSAWSAPILDEMSDVIIVTPAVDEVLRFNGVNWVNGQPTASSSSPGIEFFNATPTITASGTNNALPVFSLSKTPVVTAEQTAAGTAASNTVPFAAWLYNTALGRTLIDAGIWDFSTWCAVDSVAAGRVTTLTRQIYSATPFATGTVTTTGSGTSRTATASAGTPFATANIDASATNTTASYLQTPQGLYQITARTSDTVVTISTLSTYVNESSVAGTVWKKLFGITTPAITTTGTNYSLVQFTTAQSSYTISATAKLGAISFVTSNNTTTLTLTYNGTARNTHFETPLITLHNNLAGLQGGTANEFYHLTAAEYTGSGTGVFARVSSPVFTTPNIGSATGTVTGNSGTTSALLSATTTVNVGSATAPSNTQVLTATSSTTATWQTPTAVPVKATGAELDTGTDDAKFATAKALKDSHNVPSVVPSTSGNVLTSNGTDWVSSPATSGTTAKGRAYQAGAQTFSSLNAWTKLLLDTTSYDPGSNWDVSTNHRFIAPVTGYYQVCGNIIFQGYTADTRHMSAIYVNGAATSYSFTNSSTADGYIGAQVSDILFLTSGQYVELFGNIAGNTTTSILPGSGNVYLSIHLLSV